MTENAADYELVIRPKYGLFNINWQEIKEYRELLYFLALREIQVRYKQTIMGASWALIQPFFSMIVFSLIFGKLAQMPSDGIPYPLFSYSGLLLWTYFSNSLSSSSNSLIGSGGLLTKVYIPRIFIPTAPCLSGLVDYIIAMIVLVLMMGYYNFAPSLEILLLPIVVLTTFLLTSGMGYWLSSICVKYRDVKFILSFFIQMIMFVSPVIYPISIVDKNLQWLLYINPMTGLISAHRACLLGNTPVDFVGLSISVLLAIVIFLTGILYLKHTEKYFADLI